MNPDGTIAGAPGLNLTDGNGRIIPVNLSVSIPVLSSAQVSENSRQKSSGGGESSNHSAITSIFNHTSSSSSRSKVNIAMMNDDSGQITPRQSNSSKFFLFCFINVLYNHGHFIVFSEIKVWTKMCFWIDLIEHFNLWAADCSQSCWNIFEFSNFWILRSWFLTKQS